MVELRWWWALLFLAACSTDASLGARFGDGGADGATADGGVLDCVPMTELCDDGVDNDCDGTVDDAACEPRPCATDVELCQNAMDDDCDGTVDEGCALPDCGCTWAVDSVQQSTADLALARGLDANQDTVLVAFNPAGARFGFVYTEEGASVVGRTDVPVVFHQVDQSGAPIGAPQELVVMQGTGLVRDFVWTGYGYVLLWYSDGDAWGLATDPQGVPLGEPRLLNRGPRTFAVPRTGPVALVRGDRVYVAVGLCGEVVGDCEVRLWRYDAALSSLELEAASPATTGSMGGLIGMVETDRSFLVGGAVEQDGNAEHVVFGLADGALTERLRWPALYAVDLGLVAANDEVLACYSPLGRGSFQSSQPVECRVLNYDGVLVGTPFDVGPPIDGDVAMAVTGCGFLVSSYLDADQIPLPPEALFAAPVSLGAVVEPVLTWTAPQTGFADTGGIAMTVLADATGSRFEHFRFRRVVEAEESRYLEKTTVVCR